MTPSERAALVARALRRAAPVLRVGRLARHSHRDLRDHAHRLCTLAALWLEEAADLRAKADAATARANRLKALLDAAKEGA